MDLFARAGPGCGYVYVVETIFNVASNVVIWGYFKYVKRRGLGVDIFSDIREGVDLLYYFVFYDGNVSVAFKNRIVKMIKIETNGPKRDDG